MLTQTKFNATDTYFDGNVEVTYGYNNVQHLYFAVVQIIDQGSYHWQIIEDASISHLYHKVDDAFSLLAIC